MVKETRSSKKNNRIKKKFIFGKHGSNLSNCFAKIDSWMRVIFQDYGRLHLKFGQMIIRDRSCDSPNQKKLDCLTAYPVK